MGLQGSLDESVFLVFHLNRTMGLSPVHSVAVIEVVRLGTLDGKESGFDAHHVNTVTLFDEVWTALW